MTMTARSYLVLALAVAFALSPLAAPGFRGFDLAAFPEPLARPPLQPADYAFAIWGPIYAWLVAMAVYGALRRAEDAAWDATRGPLAISFGIGAAWLPVATAFPVLATVMLWFMLAAALAALARTPRHDRWWLRASVGLYAGWLTAAAAVATATVAAGHGIAGAAPSFWGMASLSLCFAVAAGAIVTRPSGAYGAALLWALAGVVVGHGPSLVGAYALVGAAMVAVLVMLQWRRIVARSPSSKSSSGTIRRAPSDRGVRGTPVDQ